MKRLIAAGMLAASYAMTVGCTPAENTPGTGAAPTTTSSPTTSSPTTPPTTPGASGTTTNP